mmetsp:Transcript_177337/g.568608  ORF Transcript_177337/g.568608 Transcript_177337/m.568608 type:complete len:259 (-) Transcript_177337:18-794(-)
MLLRFERLDDCIVRTIPVQRLRHRAGGAAVEVLLPAHGLRDKQHTHHLDVGMLRSTMQRIVVPDPSPPVVHAGEVVGLQEGSDLLAALSLAQGGLRGRPEELGVLRSLHGASPGLLVQLSSGLPLHFLFGRLRILSITAMVRFLNRFVRHLARILRVVILVQSGASASALQERRKSSLVATVRAELLPLWIAGQHSPCRPSLAIMRAGIIVKRCRNILTSILLVGGSVAIGIHHRRHGRERHCSAKSCRAVTGVRREC